MLSFTVIFLSHQTSSIITSYLCSTEEPRSLLHPNPQYSEPIMRYLTWISPCWYDIAPVPSCWSPYVTHRNVGDLLSVCVHVCRSPHFSLTHSGSTFLCPLFTSNPYLTPPSLTPCSQAALEEVLLGNVRRYAWCSSYHKSNGHSNQARRTLLRSLLVREHSTGLYNGYWCRKAVGTRQCRNVSLL